jgi:hypothetical protein
MSRPLGIIAYGDADDRLRLAAVAKFLDESGSAVVIRLIREQYTQLFGDLNPRHTVSDV